jgi:hypothetical protein
MEPPAQTDAMPEPARAGIDGCNEARAAHDLVA